MEQLFLDVAKFLEVDLTMFATQTTVLNASGNDLSHEMKTYYDKTLLKNAVPLLVHDQFGQKKPIPKGSGKIIEFRKYSPLGKATTALTEGVTPAGNSLDVTTITATVKQYGDFIEISDMLDMTAIDNNLIEATKLLGNQAGETLDTITRDVINAGTNVQYCEGNVLSRYLLVGGSGTPANNHYMSVNAVRLAVRNLKNNKAKKINGTYVAIINPDVAYDLTADDDWVSAAQYAGSSQIFDGEIGKLHGVRFVETTEAKIFYAPDLVATGGVNDARTLTVASYNAKVITIDEALSAADALALAGRYIIVDGYKYTVVSATAGAAGAALITISESPTHAPADNDVVYPGEAGAAGRDVYSTLFLGMDAYGVTEVSGGGLETIIKQLGSAGTADALNQRATSGWKATKVAEMLYEGYMVRVETASTFNPQASN